MNSVYTKKHMKICLVSREYPPETGYGGIGTYTYELAHGLAKLGHEVHVISYGVDHEREYKDELVHVHRIKEGTTYGLWRFRDHLPISAFFYSLRVSQKIHELIERFQIEIVEAPEWGAEGFWYAFNKRIPLIIRFHTPLFVIEELNQIKPTLKGALLKWMEKTASLKADFYGAPSRQMAELIDTSYGINADKITVLPLPINSELYQQFQKQDGNELTVLYTGRFEIRKGILVLADAIPLVLEKMPLVKFVFIGKDIFSDRYKVSIKELILSKVQSQGQVAFIDHIQREKIIEHYTRSSVCVVPSIWENFGYTVIEPMSCGTPVVITNKVGVGEFVEDRQGILKVPAENSEKLAQAMLQILKDQEFRTLLGRKARESVKKTFSTEVVSQQYEEYYQHMLEEFNPKIKESFASCLKPVKN